MTMEGAVEVAPRTHLADVICDLVSTGNTLTSNGLQEQEVILQSQAILVKNSNLNEDIQAIFKKLLSRIRAVLRADNSRYIMLNSPIAALDSIKAVLPGSHHNSDATSGTRIWSRSCVCEKSLLDDDGGIAAQWC